MERTLGDVHAVCRFRLVQVQQIAETQHLHFVGPKNVQRPCSLWTEGLCSVICTTPAGNLSSRHVLSLYDMNIYSFHCDVNRVTRAGHRWTDTTGNKTMLRDSSDRIQKSTPYLMRSATTNTTTMRAMAMKRI